MKHDRSCTLSSLRMANDLTNPISRSHSEQSSFASLTSDSGSFDDQDDNEIVEENELMSDWS